MKGAVDYIEDCNINRVKVELMTIIKKSLKLPELGAYFFDQRVSFVCAYVTPMLLITEIELS